MKKIRNISQTRNTLFNKFGTNHIVHPCPALINQQHMHTKSNFLLVTKRLYLMDNFTFKTRSTVIMKTAINCETITIATPALYGPLFISPGVLIMKRRVQKIAWYTIPDDSMKLSCIIKQSDIFLFFNLKSANKPTTWAKSAITPITRHSKSDTLIILSF